MWTISIQDMLKRNYKTAYKSLPRPYLLKYPNDVEDSNCKKYNKLVDRYNELIQCSPVQQLTDEGRLLTYSLVIEDHYILKMNHNCGLKYHSQIWEMFRELIVNATQKSSKIQKNLLDNTVKYSQEFAQQVIANNC